MLTSDVWVCKCKTKSERYKMIMYSIQVENGKLTNSEYAFVVGCRAASCMMLALLRRILSVRSEAKVWRCGRNRSLLVILADHSFLPNRI